MARRVNDFVARVRRKVIPAVPVPFDRRGQIDRASQRAYVSWMARQPIGAVAVWAHTGRGLLLTDDQRAAVLEAWRDGVGETPIVCGVGAPRRARLPSAPAALTERVIALTVGLAEAARKGGAAAVMVHPPTALRGLRDRGRRVIAVHRAVAEVGLPVLAFHLYPAAGGVAYSPDTLGRILAIHRVVGIKVATLDSVMTFQDVAMVVREIPSALLISGEDRFLGYTLMLGAGAALIGLASACTDIPAALLAAWFARDYLTFLQRSAAVDAFGYATFTAPMEGYVQRMLWALEAEGVIPPGSRDPFAPRLPPGDHERVAQAVRALRGR
ncbi:MAG: dihydrodipicolinate synthase family protein [Gemmatimonadetes bacterium]|nr:dihydrodipicolinate synthase family protein [Gemmatimonadota bacterium]